MHSRLDNFLASKFGLRNIQPSVLAHFGSTIVILLYFNLIPAASFLDVR